MYLSFRLGTVRIFNMYSQPQVIDGDFISLQMRLRLHATLIIVGSTGFMRFLLAGVRTLDYRR